MRILLQKVSQASVTVGSQTVGSIKDGYLLFVGIVNGDTKEQADWLIRKVSNLRLYAGESGKINDRSIVDTEGQLLIVSQFTLAADIQNGNRPEFTRAAPPAEAELLYRYIIEQFSQVGVSRVETGEFGAMMRVNLINEGPVTLLLER